MNIQLQNFELRTGSANPEKWYAFYMHMQKYVTARHINHTTKYCGTSIMQISQCYQGLQKINEVFFFTIFSPFL